MTRSTTDGFPKISSLGQHKRRMSSFVLAVVLISPLSSHLRMTWTIKLVFASSFGGNIFNSVAMFEKDPNFHRVKDIYNDLVNEVVEASDGEIISLGKAGYALPVENCRVPGQRERLEKEASLDAQGVG